MYNTATVKLSPWVDYTFRVIAYNMLGESDPSPPSSVCSTKSQGVAPDSNPKNLRTIGDTRGKLHIEWTVSGYLFITAH